jgi:putative hemolysin
VDRHLQLAAATAKTLSKRSLTVGFATDSTEIEAAKRLRYEVFAREMGARLHSPYPDLDHDQFDDHCYHLVVRESVTDQVVGYTRILTDHSAIQAGGFYSQTEFDLTHILAMSGRFAEIGRTCIHADYRNGTTITTLWTGLAAFIAKLQIDYLIGCASIPLGEGGNEARAIFADLSQRYMAAETLRARPLIPLPRQDSVALGEYHLPPLLKAYLRLGAKICGEPYLDMDFNVADLFIIVSTHDLTRRYARHFLGQSPQ